MKKSIVLSVLIFGLANAIAAVPAFGDTTLYTTLGPGGAYDTSFYGGYFVDGSNFNSQVIGNPFTLGSAVTVNDAVLALGNFGGNNKAVSVYIESDSNGSPGIVLASLTQVGTIPSYFTGSRGGLVTFTCTGDNCSFAADSYWLVAVELDPGTQQLWDRAYDRNIPTAILAVNHFDTATGPWDVEGNDFNGFQIDGTQSSITPEPSTFLLLGSGLAGLAGLIKRKLTA